MSLSIDFTPRARENLDGFRKYEQQIILQAIEVNLAHQPDRPSRHRKKLEDNPLAPWELRVGDFRVFYDVDHDNTRVTVVAVGHKVHDVLRIGGKEIWL